MRHESMWSGGVTDPLILNLSSTMDEWAASSSGCFSPENVPGIHCIVGRVGSRAGVAPEKR